MYFITKENRGISAIGIYEDIVYGLGKKNNKLIVYQKAMLDACDWKIFYKTNIRALPLQFSCCCIGGIHAAGSIIDSKIWIIVQEKKYCRCISIDIPEKKLTDYKKVERQQIPLFCFKCSNPTIRPHDFENDNPRYMITFVTTSRCNNIFSKTFILHFLINETEKSFRFTYRREYEWYPRFGIGNNDEIISVKKRKHGFITTFLMETALWETKIENVFGEWEDIFFYHNDTNLYCLTKTKDTVEHNFKICVYIVESFLPEKSLNFIFQFSFIVDLNFPSFHLTRLFMAPNGFIFSTPYGLVTILNRMLSLSESAYVSLFKLKHPQMDKIQETAFQKLIKIMKLKKKNKMNPWMSLNFIKDVLRLPNSFSLKSLAD